MADYKNWFQWWIGISYVAMLPYLCIKLLNIIRMLRYIPYHIIESKIFIQFLGNIFNDVYTWKGHCVNPFENLYQISFKTKFFFGISLHHFLELLLWRFYQFLSFLANSLADLLNFGSYSSKGRSYLLCLFRDFLRKWWKSRCDFFLEFLKIVHQNVILMNLCFKIKF